LSICIVHSVTLSQSQMQESVSDYNPESGVPQKCVLRIPAHLTQIDHFSHVPLS